MNILVLNGSPRIEKSNTMQLTKAFLEGLCEGNTHKVETIDVIRKDIGPCMGCFGCWLKTPGVCILKDDMRELLTLYRAADVVVWSFPLYYFGMPSHIKAFMDRLLPNNLPYLAKRKDGGSTHPGRLDLSQQKHVLISTCGFYSKQNNYEALEKQFEIQFAGRLSKILCPEGELFSVPDLEGMCAELLEHAREAGRQFAANGCIAKETEELFSQPMIDSDLFIEMGNASFDEEMTRNGLSEAAAGVKIAPSEHSDCREKGSSEAGSEEMVQSSKEAAALMHNMQKGFNPNSDAKLVLEMHFTDLNESWQFHIEGGKCKLTAGTPETYTTRIETSLGTWSDISSGKLDGTKAFMTRKYKVLGNMGTMLKFGQMFPTRS